jgi:uncharacterized protein (TIGR02145 family)
MKNFIKLSGLCFLILSSILHSCKKEELPTLSTSTITNITATSATGGGNITSDGNTRITSRGVCWSLNANPTTSDSKTSDGNGIGQFVSTLDGLTAGSTYHVRAYATNSVGTAYGADMSFATLGQVPEAITQPATNISATDATLNGTVNANYLSTTVTFEYGTTSNYGQTGTATQSPVTGNAITNVTADLTNLTVGTIYHFRVKTVNSLGTTYGNDIVFTTLGQAPTAITLPACCLTSRGAKLNGTVNANYVSTTVTFEYGTTTTYGQVVTASQSPVTGNNSTDVSANISGLTSGTTYHFRVKTINALGTAYGDDVSFITTPILLATITTTEISLFTETTAISGGNIIDDGGGIITTRGVCWATSANPTITGEHTTDGAGTGIFISNIKCLSYATTYYVRAYATNSAGIAYGDQQSFTTQGTNPIIFNTNLTYGSVSDIDGNCCKTIQIGNQTWMAENLKTTKYNDGTPIPNVTDNSEWANKPFAKWVGDPGDQLPEIYVTYGAYCWYNNDAATYNNDYGILYNWGAVGTDKLCPTGWHVPSLAEWRIICPETDYENGPYGEELMETGKTHWNESAELDGTNTTGLTALPSGYRLSTGEFKYSGYRGFYWASDGRMYSEFKYAWDIYYYGRITTPSAVLESEREGRSIRCIKDKK